MGEVNKQTVADFLRKYFKMGLFKIIPNQELSGSRERKAPARPADQDLVSAAIGDYGRWQLLITFLISLFSFPCTFHMYMSNFTVAKSDYWCARPNNLSSVPVSIWKQYSQPNGPCTIRQLPDGITAEAISNNAPVLDTFMKCTNWEFDKSEISSTIISEWLLVCERQGLTNLAEAMFLLGVGLGGVIGGWVSDKFGRKRILMFMVLAQTTLALLSLMVRSYFQYVVLRLFVGFVSVSVVYAAFVLAVEIVGGKWVTIAGVCNFFPLPLAYIIVSLVSLLLPDWRNLTLALSIPGCSLLILWFVIPESPRWLLSMGRIKETKVILQRAANFNGRALPSDIDKQLELKKAEILGQNENPGIVMLFRKGGLKSITPAPAAAARRPTAPRDSLSSMQAASAEPSKAELEAEFRADDPAVAHAATKIQASFRGHQVRKQTEKDKQDKEDIEKIDLSDPELNKAANKIQASFRTRKDNN